MNLKAMVVGAFIAVTAVSAQAYNTDGPEGQLDSFWDGGFGYGGYAGSWAIILPDVTVTCNAVCQAMAGISTLNGNEVVRVVAVGPHATSDPDAASVTTPRDPKKIKTDCIANCAVQRTVHDNTCTIQSAQLRSKLSNMPAASAIGGGLISRFIRRKIGGDIDSAPIWGAAAYGAASSEIDRKIADFTADCAAVGAKAHNDCITGTCRAWLAVPILFLSRRRRDMQMAELHA
jgi:hypothetical protein